jgi:hypothetical protein
MKHTFTLSAYDARNIHLGQTWSVSKHGVGYRLTANGVEFASCRADRVLHKVKGDSLYTE